MAKELRVLFSFDERSFDSLERIKRQGRFASLADTVRQSIEVSGTLQRQAQQGYTEVTVTNPRTGEQRVLVIPEMAAIPGKPTRLSLRQKAGERHQGLGVCTKGDEPPPENSSGSLLPGDGPEDKPQVINGGDVTLSQGRITWIQKHDTETAKALTFTLLAILTGSLALHYVVVVVLTLYEKDATVDALTDLFDKWLPVTSSFVGGAVTYYLTRRGI